VTSPVSYEKITSCACHDLHVGLAIHQGAQPDADQVLVVRQHQADRHAVLHGSSARTRKPSGRVAAVHSPPGAAACAVNPHQNASLLASRTRVGGYQIACRPQASHSGSRRARAGSPPRSGVKATHVG
jgi:hypothetical protein